MGRYLQLSVIFVLCVGLLILPIDPTYGSTFLYNEKRIFATGILIISGVVFAFIPHNSIQTFYNQISNKFFLIGVLSVLFLGLISAVFYSYTFYSVVEISLYLLLFLLASQIGLLASENSLFTWFFFGLACLFVFLYSIKFSIQYYFYINNLVSFWLWPGSISASTLLGFNNVRFFNQVQTFTLPLILGSTVFFIKRFKLLGYFLLLLTSVWWMLLIQSAGRGIILSILTAAVMILLFFKNYTHKWLWFFLVTLVIGYLSKILLFDLVSGSQTASITRGGSPRLDIWPRTFFASLDKPFLGHGPLSFADVNLDFRPSHPHNLILQLLYEFGYPVTIIILAGTFYSLKKWLRQSRKVFQNKQKIMGKDVIIRISLTTAFFAGLFYSLFSGVLLMPLSQLWFAIVSGLILGLYAKESSRGEEFSVNKFFYYAIKLVALVAAGLLILFLVRDIPTLEENEREFTEKTSLSKKRPRLWQQGKIGLDHYTPK